MEHSGRNGRGGKGGREGEARKEGGEGRGEYKELNPRDSDRHWEDIFGDSWP